MGTRGPVPKRTGDRLGHLTKAQKAAAEKVDVTGIVEPPAAEPTWHPLVRDWYESLKDSAQRRYLEPSDWAMARILAESLSRDLKPKVLGIGIDGPIEGLAPLNGASLTAYLRAMGEVLTTEASRRRVQLEVNRKAVAAVAAPVVQMNDYRAL